MGKLVAVHLHGPLGERFGELHHFAVQSPSEALRALDANYPGFLAAFAAHERYGVMVDDDWREGDMAGLLPASKSIHFVPAIEGEVPFVAIGLTAAFGLSATAATIIGSLLVTALMIGVSLLFRPKKPPGPAEPEEIDESFIFSGPENVTGQGVAVPLIYGRVYAGTVVVSAGQDTVDVAITTSKSGSSKPSSGNSSKPAGYNKPEYRGGHDGRMAVAKAMGAPLAPETFTEDPYEPWPDLINDGAGTDHLREPPNDDWPAIVADPVYVFRPVGWVPVKSMWVSEEDDVNRKQVYVWQPDYETKDQVYNWNMVRGFYVTEIPVLSTIDIDGVPTEVPGVIAYVEPEEDEWIDGAVMEEPITDPAP